MTVPAQQVDAEANLSDIQGGLIGFNKDHQRLIFVQFQDQSTAAALLAELKPLLASGWEVLNFNALYGEILSRGNKSGLGIIESSWTNIWLSATGLSLVAPTEMAAFPADFTQGMAARAAIIGDSGKSAPDAWTAPNTGGSVPHAVIVVAADSEAGIEAASSRARQIMAAHGATELPSAQDGNVRPEPMRGKEHFGFKDGISQPGIAGFTESSKPGSGSIAPGEFLIGYPDEDGNISGNAPTPVIPPVPDGYPPALPAGAPPLPAWARNGSFVVYRRLRQTSQRFISSASRTLEPGNWVRTSSRRSWWGGGQAALPWKAHPSTPWIRTRE